MRLFSKCEGCGKRKLFIRKRAYHVKVAGRVMSQKELCGRCAKMIKTMLGGDLQK